MTVLTAANMLRTFPAFQKTSLRHLTDLVEKARPKVMTIHVDDPKPVSAVFSLVLSGHGVAGSILPLAPGQTVLMALIPMLEALMAGTSFAGRPFIAGRPATGFTFTLANTDVPLKSTTETLWILPLDRDLLHDATIASPSFGSSVDLGVLFNPQRAYSLFDAVLGR
jgi:hypothetical protein